MTPTDDIIKALGFAPGALLPFASAPYTLKLIPSTDVNAVKLKAKLRANVQASFTTYPDGKAMRVPFSMIILSSDPNGAHLYAGVDDDQMCYAGSLLKPGVMYAAYELRAAVNRVAATLDIPSTLTEQGLPAQLVTALDAAFKAKLARWRWAPTLDKLTPVTPGWDDIFRYVSVNYPPVDFNLPSGPGDDVDDKGFGKNLNDMIVVSGDAEAAACIHALGFTYINLALATGGFFGLGAGGRPGGIWISGDYADLEYRPIATMNDGMGKLAMDTAAMCRLFALIELNKLIDAESNSAMSDLLTGAVTGNPPWILRKDLNDPAGPVNAPFTVLRNKLGFGPLGRGPDLPASPHVYSECSILEWDFWDVDTTNALAAMNLSRKIIICWQNYLEPSTQMWSPVRDVVVKTIAQFLT